MNLFKPQIKLLKGTRFISFLFISVSVLIAAGILWAANMYYNIDTQEVVIEEVQRVTGILRATAGAIVGGTASQDPATGYGFEVATSTKFSSGDVVLSAANQVLRFTGGTSYYTGFKATTALTTTTVYAWPGTYPAGSGYYLTADPTTGQMSWGIPSGAGDITDVGDCPSGACFTPDGAGNTLYFEGATADINEIILTAADPNADYTITLPARTGTVALGTSTANYVAYWTDTNTLAGEAQLATSRGGTGADSSAWSGMVRVVGGSWGAVTGNAGYAAYWSDANTVAAEQYLSVTRGGTGAGSFTQYGLIYGNNTSALGVTPVGTANQLLVSNGGVSAPSWSNIADLITATNGLTESGTTNLTIKLGGSLTESTTITQGNFDMIFALTGTGDFRITDGTNNIFQITNDGKVLFGANNYPIAESGKQILREMIPILGFDLPAQTATTSYVQISRVLEDYPFSATSSGTTRVHKFIIRYADATTTTSTNWRVYNVTAATTTATFTVPPTGSVDLEKGEAYITGSVAIPTNTDDWRLDLSTPGTAIRVYQIFLAAYDQIQ